MSASQVHQLILGPLTAHAFNKDNSELAVSSNSNTVQLYKSVAGSFKPHVILEDHDKLVTSIDWAPNTNRIVTCSQDRNAYVWTQTNGVWKPTLVLLRINRAATYVKWSPNEQKFAVGSGARTIAICYFEEDNDWWVSKHLKKPIRSTVLNVDWHPNSVLLGAGSADGKARVFSAFIKGVDAKPEPTVWGDRLPFNTVCGEFSSSINSWVHAVSFSPSGDALAFVSHDSSISIAYGPSHVVHVRTPNLPFVSLTWINETSILAAGHDCQPMLFHGSQQQWTFDRSLDDPSKAVAKEASTSAFNKFRQMDSRAQASNTNDTELSTVHQNTITAVRKYDAGPNGVSKVSTIGIDGKLCIWDV